MFLVDLNGDAFGLVCIQLFNHLIMVHIQTSVASIEVCGCMAYIVKCLYSILPHCPIDY